MGNIYVVVREEEGWRTITNAEQQTLFGDMDVVVKTKQRRIRWAGHVQRLPELGVLKKVFLRKTDVRMRRPGVGECGLTIWRRATWKQWE